MKIFSSKGKFLTEIASVNPVLSKSSDFLLLLCEMDKINVFL